MTLRSQRAGLTLMEVLVAMTVGSMVLAAVLGVLSVGRRTQQMGEARTDLFQSVRVPLNQLQRDLSAAVYLQDAVDTTALNNCNDIFVIK